MSVRYLEDFSAGQRFSSGPLRVDAEQIRRFAAEFDPQPFHLDAQAALGTFFNGLAASGWHTAALTMRLLVDSDLKPAGWHCRCRLRRLSVAEPGAAWR